MDEITLTVPAERRFLGVVNLVVGGLGSRLDLPYEQVDDLQLAVDSVLSHGDQAGGSELVVEMQVGEQRLVLRVGPLADGSSGDPGLQRVLTPLVQSAVPLERDGRDWLELQLQRRAIEVQEG
jgi:hypothetical protein